MTSEERAAIGIPDGFLRLSIGIENAEDLIADIEQALQSVDDPTHRRLQGIHAVGCRARHVTFEVKQGRIRLPHRAKRRRQDHDPQAALHGRQADDGRSVGQRRQLEQPRADARSRSCAAGSASSSRISGCSRTAPPKQNVAFRARGDRRAEGDDSARKVARAADAGRPRVEGDQLSARAVRRRAAARRDRARARQRPVRSHRRRADRQPRRARDARHLPAAARHQRVGHRRDHGDARPRARAQLRTIAPSSSITGRSCSTRGRQRRRPSDDAFDDRHALDSRDI